MSDRSFVSLGFLREYLAPMGAVPKRDEFLVELMKTHLNNGQADTIDSDLLPMSTLHRVIDKLNLRTDQPDLAKLVISAALYASSSVNDSYTNLRKAYLNLLDHRHTLSEDLKKAQNTHSGQVDEIKIISEEVEVLREKCCQSQRASTVPQDVNSEPNGQSVFDELLKLKKELADLRHTLKTKCMLHEEMKQGVKRQQMALNKTRESLLEEVASFYDLVEECEYHQKVNSETKDKTDQIQRVTALVKNYMKAESANEPVCMAMNQKLIDELKRLSLKAVCVQGNKVESAKLKADLLRKIDAYIENVVGSRECR